MIDQHAPLCTKKMLKVSKILVKNTLGSGKSEYKSGHSIEKALVRVKIIL